MDKQLSVVYTNKAKCRDCYRCIRSCPVNAIKIANEQASIIPEKCIACGTCILECPQEAKAYIRERDIVMQMLDKGLRPAISIAPSFVSAFEQDEIRRLPSALRKAGFSFITETAHAAYHVSVQSAGYIQEHPEKNLFISSSCPAVVSYIEKYYPSLIGALIPVLSPAMAHARMLKEQLGRHTPVVFAGPCIAKKDEAGRSENRPHLDAVLTFTELMEILKLKFININDCEEGSFDEEVAGNASLYPVEGGFLKTAGFNTDMLSGEIVAVSGKERVKELLDELPGRPERMIVEPLFCEGGCINGPDIARKNTLYRSRSRVIDYDQNAHNTVSGDDLRCNIATSFNAGIQVPDHGIEEDAIREVLARTGKSHPDNQLNCGACGYKSCRDNAIAVIMGQAEPNMCIPYMRRLAEQKNDILFSTDPNGIIMLDDKLRIQHINPAFKKMFSCTDAILNKPVSYLIDPEPFEKLLADGRKPVHSVVSYRNYNLVCHQIHYAIPEENHYVGIFVDITAEHDREQKLREIKSNTILQAQHFLDHQIKTAQKMTKFLGESSAKGEILMRDLIDALNESRES